MYVERLVELRFLVRWEHGIKVELFFCFVSGRLCRVYLIFSLELCCPPSGEQFSLVLGRLKLS